MAIFDMSAVCRLESETGSRAFVRRFVGTYQRMLLPRVERLVDAVRDGDVAEALDAGASLRVSSVMMGATELAELSAALIEDLKTDDLPAAQGKISLLTRAALQTRAAIAEAFVESPAAVPAQEPMDSIR